GDGLTTVIGVRIVGGGPSGVIASGVPRILNRDPDSVSFVSGPRECLTDPALGHASGLAVRCSHRELFGTRVPFRLQLALDLAGTVIRGGVGVGAGSVRSIAVSACVVVAIGVCFGLRRSEERRVGKERRTSGATGQSSSR